MSDICIDCGAALKPNPRRKGSRCLSCFNKRPRSAEERALVAAKVAASWEKQRKRPGRIDRISKGQLRAHERDPALLERRREHMRRIQAKRAAGGVSDETRAKLGAAVTERFLGWCPLVHRDHYRKLVGGHVPAAEARAMIEELMATDRRRVMQRFGMSTGEGE